MIANCPSCGTHYKHELPKVTTRARCGRCDATVDLSRLRPYRIVTASSPRPEDAATASRYSPIGLDHPALATAIARNVAAPATPPTRPQPPALAIASDAASTTPAVDSKAGTIPAAESVTPKIRVRGSAAGIALWTVGGAIVGAGVAWGMGGTTMIGLAVGAVLATAAGWGWLRWTSPK